VLPGKPPSGARQRKQTRNVLKMSEDIISADNYDYSKGVEALQETLEHRETPGQGRLHVEGIVDLSVDDVDDLDVEIMEKEL
jgi:hypothetical protein